MREGVWVWVRRSSGSGLAATAGCITDVSEGKGRITDVSEGQGCITDVSEGQGGDIMMLLGRAHV